MLQKKDYIFIFTAVIAIAAGVMVKMHSTRPTSIEACNTLGADHEITLNNDQFSSESITVNRCDRIIFINKDTKPYHIAMGLHDRHVTYPGFFADTIPAEGGMSFVAVKTGDYELHDHLRDNAHTTLHIQARQ